MAYDEHLASRIRKSLSGTPGITEKKMFGGVCFLRHGLMFAGVTDGALMARVGKANYEDSLSREHVRVMDFTGKPLRGFVYVAPAGVTTEPALAEWVAAGLAGAREAARAKTSKPRQRSPTPRAGQRRARPSRER